MLGNCQNARIYVAGWRRRSALILVLWNIFFNSQHEGIERMPVSLTGDTSPAGAVSVVETKIIILNYCPNLKRLS